MAQACRDPLGDALSIVGAAGLIGRQGVQDEDLAPLVALVQGRQQLGDVASHVAP